MNELDYFLLKLHLCGLDLKNELLLAEYLTKFKHCPSKAEFFELLSLSKSRIEKLFDALQSRELAQKLKYNLALSNVLTILDARYPQNLREIYQPPVVLFYRGDIGLLESAKKLGIVGSRQCSTYATRVLTELLPQVLTHKLTLVSGLAKGVDGMVHQITLQHGGQTIAVIGNGLNICYPRCNLELQHELETSGLILSEYALDVAPLKYHFPLRNRIIAGLSQSVFVVEARHKSGSLITANIALQENRNVLALPGRITDPLSQGCNELILAGAKPVLASTDILEEFNY